MFRPEVAQAKQQAWLGEIQLAVPSSSRTALVLALVFLIVASITVWVGQYTSRERVTGKIVPTKGIIKVTDTLPGTVSNIFVREGQSVHAGQHLVEVSGEQQSVARGATRSLVIEQLNLERDRLRKEFTSQEEAAVRQKSSLAQKLSSLRSQMMAIGVQITIAQKEAVTSEEMLTHMKPLTEKGYVSALQVHQQESAALNALSQLKSFERQHSEIELQIIEINDELRNFPAQSAAKSNTILRQVALTEQQLAQTEAQRAQVFDAAISGVVATVPARMGQAVVEGELLLTILPAGTSLRAELLVPSRAAGFVQPGDRVILRYEAYPFQHFGQQWGSVERVSRTSLLHDELPASSTYSNQLYRVEITLDHETINANGEDIPLKPGMALEADILKEKRRLIDWVFAPVGTFLRNSQGRGA